jgi:membrane protein YqaA with SNARE-associated domain
MNKTQLPAWLQYLVGSLGGVGLFAVASLDSSVLSFPIVTDLLVIEESIRIPARMPYYAGMAAIGSLAGCIWLYWLAKKGGEAMFRRRAGARAQWVRGWVERNAFLSVAIPSILPPPMPFKVFVLAAGVFQVPLRTFVLALLVGRGFRYFAEGFLAVRYGDTATRFLVQNKLGFTLIALALIVVSYAATRFLLQRSATK